MLERKHHVTRLDQLSKCKRNESWAVYGSKSGIHDNSQADAQAKLWQKKTIMVRVSWEKSVKIILSFRGPQYSILPIAKNLAALKWWKLQDIINSLTQTIVGQFAGGFHSRMWLFGYVNFQVWQGSPVILFRLFSSSRDFCNGIWKSFIWWLRDSSYFEFATGWFFVLFTEKLATQSLIVSVKLDPSVPSRQREDLTTCAEIQII